MTSNTFHKLRDEIENGIITGGFEPGERLDETQLATRFGVSRTPIREALMQLSAIGLVEIRPRRGAVVVDPGPQYVFEMFEVMAELEGMAGASAARRHTPEDREALIQAHERCKAAAISRDSDAYYYENETFHHAIYTASHNRFLGEQCVTLHRRLRPYRRLQLRVGNRMNTSFDEHGAIVDSILAGESETARQRLRAHIVVQGDRFGDLVAHIQTMKAKPSTSAG
ncbi:GntR family transcriptional regulator [Rhizobium halophytocola]|uniref:DNA-binding GntR family transcriptional regulator n=1 Tax=Rhizobium halophytocola TaxID=735519 RepID=A0ABS4E0X2_9HYPH|nr:GntR family transcriptional regulator [Rhizobium halophytocola]MBP1851592.1 DNA-binding GntR family transcriptional regulator [Rhizobium halophytocola]